MRTSGRRIRSGERSRAECDRCGALWDRDKLWRDREGLLNCPLEGRGRDAVELTEANVAAAKAHSASRRPVPHDPGRYDKTPATRFPALTPGIMTESFLLMGTERGDPLVTESIVTVDVISSQDELGLLTEAGETLGI